MKKFEPCPPLHLTCEEARLLIIAAGSRLEHMVKAHAAGAITGRELQRHMDMGLHHRGTRNGPHGDCDPKGER